MIVRDQYSKIIQNWWTSSSKTNAAKFTGGLISISRHLGIAGTLRRVPQSCKPLPDAQVLLLSLLLPRAC